MSAESLKSGRVDYDKASMDNLTIAGDRLLADVTEHCVLAVIEFLSLSLRQSHFVNWRFKE